MKNMKKLLAVMLAVALTLALTIPAFAEGTYDVTYTDGTSTPVTIVNNNAEYTLLAFDATALSDLAVPAGKNFYKWDIGGTQYEAGASVTLTGPVTATAVYRNTLTITGALTDHTFSAYQIFAGTYKDFEGDDGLESIVWGSGFDQTKVADLIADLKEEFTDAETYAKIQALDAADSAKCTPAAIAAAIAVIPSDAPEEGAGTPAEALADIFAKYTTGTPAVSTETDAPYTITDLEDGYYIVKDTDNNATDADDVVSDFILEVLNGTTVAIKGNIPTVDKKVSTDGGTSYADGESTEPVNVQIGDILDYMITGTLPYNYVDYAAYKMVFTDTPDESIVLDTTAGTYGVYVDAAGDGTLTEVGSGAVVVITANSLTVTIDDTKSLMDAADTPAAITTTSASQIVVKYQAEVINTTVSGTADTNTATITYSNDPNSTSTGTTTGDTVDTITQSFKLVKYDGADNKLLAGATFQLLKDGAAVSLVKESNTLYHAADSTETGADTFTTVSTTDAITIRGLDADVTYTLVETVAPAGYNLLASGVNVTVSDDTTAATPAITGGVYSATDNVTAIANNSGSILPETGGVGTTLLIAFGSLLFIGTALVLVTKKRMYNEG